MRVLPADISHYGHDLPNLDPPVIIKPKAFRPEFCAKVAAAMLEADSKASGVHEGKTAEKIDNYHRSSTWCTLNKHLYDVIAGIITAVVNEAVRGQLKPLVLGEGLQFLKYDEANNGRFLSHTDNAYFGANGEFLYTSPQRRITTISYMNEAYEGGQIVLNSVLGDDAKPITIQPTTGLLLIFPSDIRFAHEVLPVTKGTRCNVVGWFK